MGNKTVTGFLKKERRITLIRLLHLPNMANVITADAIDPPNRKNTAAFHR